MYKTNYKKGNIIKYPLFGTEEYTMGIILKSRYYDYEILPRQRKYVELKILNIQRNIIDIRYFVEV